MVDRWFGFFMESLQNSGKLKDTVVAVISDHGHNLGLRGDAQRISKEAHPMTHAIADLVLMIRHPGGEGKGQTCEKLVYNHDLMRTLLDMASVESDPGMDGMNIWQPALKKDQATRSHISCCWGTAVTVVDGQMVVQLGCVGRRQAPVRPERGQVSRKQPGRAKSPSCAKSS